MLARACERSCSHLMTVAARHKAVEVILAVSAGAYQTTLLTYMVQRDLFPAVMKVLAYPAVMHAYLDPLN